ncbi:ComF family protein [Eremococcus coleocola]|uniref:Competence protein F family protein n=1 Tax=Eremococcus coleocola ACS-139-V-Col8 TaxID=908337 RepID=E4KMY2_9LACT|nr:ComF family protein [Eremococcus coleocola]EFR31671.1 competence protein F family protein [Eremococcus coleocola ACS-139-V-Col8]
MNDTFCEFCQGKIPKKLALEDIFAWRPLNTPYICSDCFEAWLQIQDMDQSHRCKACHRILKSGGEADYCQDCLRWLDTYPSYYLRHHYLFAYTDMFRDWLFRYKYHGDIYLGQLLKGPLEHALKVYRSYSFIILPSSPTSLSQRNFHPVGHLLDLVKQPYCIPFDYQGDGRKQARKSRQERLKLSQPFVLNQSGIDFIKAHEKIIFFDDVYTTGTTLLSAKRAMIETPYFTDKHELISLSLVRE